MNIKLYSTLLALSFPVALFSQKPINCSLNKFWAVSLANGIEQFDLTGGVLTFDSVVTNSSNTFSLSIAFCNNLDNTSGPPTFYNTNSTQIAYYDGSGWTVSTVNPPINVYNGGGNGDYLYFTGNSTLDEIMRYTGTSISSIYSVNTAASRKITVADLAVDDAGNVWCFTGNTGSIITDSILVISPAGQVLAQYAVSFTSGGAYGCFLLNGVLYVGFGSTNSAYPNSLIPITVSGGSASIGTPIPLPAINYADLASCNNGAPLSVDHIKAQAQFGIFPNPAVDIINITSENLSKSDCFKIYSIEGVTPIMTTKSTQNNFQLNIQNLSSGVYILSRENSSGVFRKVFVKQ